MNVRELSNAILKVDSREELKILIGSIYIRASELTKREAMQFRIGDLVEFRSSKRGTLIQGRIQKVNNKTVSLHETSAPYTLWRVSPGLLRLVDKKSGTATK